MAPILREPDQTRSTGETRILLSKLTRPKSDLLSALARQHAGTLTGEAKAPAGSILACLLLPRGARWIVWCGGVLGGDGGGGGGGGVQFASLNGAAQLCALQWEDRGESSRKSGGPAAAVSRICPSLTLASPKAEVVCRFNNLHTQKESEIEGREGGGLCWNGIHQSLWSSCLVLC